MKIYICARPVFVGLLLFANISFLKGQNKPTGNTRPVAQGTSNPAAYNTTIINYVRTWLPSIPIADPNVVTDPARGINEVQQTTEYIDGLGRSLQVVNKGASGSGNDLIKPIVYDDFGREQYQYLPYASQGLNNGKFKSDPFNNQTSFYQSQTLNPGVIGENIYYREIAYDASPLNRILKTYEAGNNWARNGGNRPHGYEYLSNTAADNVRMWTMTGNSIIPVSTQSYAVNKLFKNLVKDENGNDKIEFKDLDGKLILKKTAMIKNAPDGHDSWLCTYYVYDKVGNLCAVIPPKAVNLIKTNWSITSGVADGLCYFYRYDNRERMVMKKLPGADSTELVYDKRDRLVFYRDGNLRNKEQQWMVIFYDAINRKIMTGLYGSTLGRDSLQKSMNTSAVSVGTIEYTFPAVADLVVSSHDGRQEYNATNSITFENGFETGANAEMNAEIKPNSNNGKITLNVNNPLPNLDQGKLIPLTYDFYDNYNFTGANPCFIDDLKEPSSDDPYAEKPSTFSNMTNGLVTGGKLRVVGTNQWISGTVYYDNKGRPIQVITENITGGKDISTNLYNFNGSILSNYMRHRNLRSVVVPDIRILTKMTYDPMGRVKRIIKRLNGDVNTERTVADNEYDELGRLKIKKLNVVNNSALDALTYEYNVRGWLSGINKNFVNTGGENWFGQELDYDNGFLKNQYNGNVSGIKWKGKSDGVARAYGYDYDAVNRLLKADFSEQNSTGTTWGVDKNDFSVDNLTYDENGNILTMNQNGMDGISKVQMDKLLYTYKGMTNRLDSVVDKSPVKSRLGDFKGAIESMDSYGYDADGNVNKDKNRDITSIVYNYLNLPQTISIKDKGTISYLYDASGTKLKKIVTDNTIPNGKVTVTDYMSGFTYQQDTLQYFGHEEGRVRLIYKTGLPPAFAYDYFEKDHLGNVRVVLTENSEISSYVATMESASAAKENVLFDNVDKTRTPLPIGYPNTGTTSTNAFVSKLNADNGAKVGPSLVLRVMAGDTLKVSTQAFYKSNAPVNGTVTQPEMLASLLQVFNGDNNSGGIHGGLTEGASSFATNFTNDTYQHLKDKDQSQNQINNLKSYLNYVLFDDQFNLVDDNSAVKQVKAVPDQIQVLGSGDIIIKKSGFFYVYTTNEEKRDIYFDNIVVTHAGGPLLEETHFYPFGLVMAGISRNAMKGENYSENRLKYNGNEIQSEEFKSGGGLDLYDFNARSYDHQLGRFLQLDPLAEIHPDNNPYNFALNNPLLYSDPLGLDTSRGPVPTNPQPGDVYVIPMPNGGEAYYNYGTNGWVGGGMYGGSLQQVSVGKSNSYDYHYTYYSSIVNGETTAQDWINYSLAGASTFVGITQAHLLNQLKAAAGNKRALYNLGESLKGINKTAKGLGWAGIALTGLNLGNKYFVKGEGLSRKDVFDATVTVVLSVVVLTNPVLVGGFAIYGLLDAAGALDPLKAAIGIDDTELISAPAEPLIRLQ